MGASGRGDSRYFASCFGWLRQGEYPKKGKDFWVDVCWEGREGVEVMEEWSSSVVGLSSIVCCCPLDTRDPAHMS